jgi:hypothetical protein
MKIWTSVATWNRKKITEIVLKQLYLNKQNSFLHVSDDYSTEYACEDMSKYCDNIERPLKKLGIHHLRCWEIEQFLKTDYDLVYFTDNDAFHDPSYIDRLKDIYKRYKMPVSLYNTRWHFNNTIQDDGDVIVRSTIPGISQLYDRKMATVILNTINQIGKINYAWDYRMIEYLKTTTVTTATSYVEHFGIDGIHNPSKDFERDRATNPTMYLVEKRQPIINYLMGREFSLNI